MGKSIFVTPIFFFSFFFLMLTLVLMSSPRGVDGNGGAHELGVMYFPAGAEQSCNIDGSMQECEMTEEEGEEGEGGRRVLYWRRRYISYGALFRDRVPCSRRGYSYYNCRPGRPVNPYVRGCSAITRCRSF